MQLTAATGKRSTTESQTWFASFIICSTREDGTFCPRLSHMPPDSRGRLKEKNLVFHYGLRSKGCFDRQCFGSSTHDLKSDLFCLSKLKYRDTKASQIKRYWTFFQPSHSNIFHCSITARRGCWLGGGPPPTHSRATSKATSGQLQLCLAQPQKPPNPLWVSFPMQHHSPSGPTQTPHGAVRGHCPLIYCLALPGGDLGPSSLQLFFKYFSTSTFSASTIPRLPPRSVSRSIFTLNLF